MAVSCLVEFVVGKKGWEKSGSREQLVRGESHRDKQTHWWVEGSMNPRPWLHTTHA